MRQSHCSCQLKCGIFFLRDTEEMLSTDAVVFPERSVIADFPAAQKQRKGDFIYGIYDRNRYICNYGIYTGAFEFLFPLCASSCASLPRISGRGTERRGDRGELWRTGGNGEEKGTRRAAEAFFQSVLFHSGNQRGVLCPRPWSRRGRELL